MIRCKRCGAENYAIDMWCSRCLQHLDWPPAAPIPEEAVPPIASAKPEVARPAAAPAEYSLFSERTPEATAERPVTAATSPMSDMAPLAAATTEESLPAEPAAIHEVPTEVAVPAAASRELEPAPTMAAVASEAAASTEFPAEPMVPPEPQAAPLSAALAVVESRSRQRAAVWLLPVAAAVAVAVLLALPVAGWFKAATHQAATPQLPLTAGIRQATPLASATPSPPATPSPSTPPAPPADQQPAAQPPADQPVPVPALPTTVGDPTRTVAGFYHAVAAHQFDAAASAWSAQMQANYPPAEFIKHRFAYTQQMNLQVARTVANNGRVSTVYIDVTEVYAGSPRHWVGTWQLVRTTAGWLLNQPNLRAAI